MKFMLLLLAILPYGLLDAAASSNLHLSECHGVVDVATSQDTTTSQAHIVKYVNLNAPFIAITCVYTDNHRCFRSGELEELAVSIDAQREQQLETICEAQMGLYATCMRDKKEVKLKIAFLRLYPHLFEYIYSTDCQKVLSLVNLKGLILLQESSVKILDKDCRQADVEQKAEISQIVSQDKNINMFIDADRWQEVIKKHAS